MIVDDATVSMSAEQAAEVADEILRIVLEKVAADLVAKGFDPGCVRFMIDERAELLRAGRPARAETLRQMLAAGATSLQ
jgi:hypothetical protein